MFDALRTRAEALFEQGKYEDSLLLFSQLVPEAPDSAVRSAIQMYRGRCLEILGRFPEARQCIEEARRGMRESSPAALAWLDYMEASVDAREDRYAVALAKFDRVLADIEDSLPGDERRNIYESVQISRAQCLHNLGRPAEAMPLFVESAGFKAEKPADYPYRMALCMAQCGERSGAKDILLRSLKCDLDVQTEGSIRYYLGRIYALEGDHEGALAEWQFCERHLDECDLLWDKPLMDSLSWAYEKIGDSNKANYYGRLARDL
jgi:tetratricopeptide (TPR) repeat protein